MLYIRQHCKFVDHDKWGLTGMVFTNGRLCIHFYSPLRTTFGPQLTRNLLSQAVLAP